MPARRDRPAQVDEHLLPSAQAARQHDLGNPHRLSASAFPPPRAAGAAVSGNRRATETIRASHQFCQRPKATHPMAKAEMNRAWAKYAHAARHGVETHCHPAQQA